MSPLEALEIGLSPRLRGNLLLLSYFGYYHGSIPAPAGEPRACGGTPRLRGNLAFAFATLELGRSIPAPAGEPPWT